MGKPGTAWAAALIRIGRLRVAWEVDEELQSVKGLDALVTKPSSPEPRNYRDGGYIKRLPNDPWGNEYQYLSPGDNGTIDIFTLGADGQEGGEGIAADIGNWNMQDFQ